MSAKKKTPFKQMTLNFGQRAQKAFKCQDCGLFYNPNDTEDNQLHTKFHNEKENVLKYTSPRTEKIVESFPNGKCIVIEAGIDQKQSLNKALTILNYIDMQLGINQNDNLNYSITDLDELEIISRMNIKESTKFYFFISMMTKKVVGFCMAEHVDKAYKIKYLNQKTSTSSFTYDESDLPERVKCGISRIWVAASMRRNGIASKLLDCVRMNFLYFRTLELKEIAFSDPTHFGQAFAKGYFKTDSFLVYNSVSRN